MNDYLHRKNGFAEVSKSLFVDADPKINLLDHENYVIQAVGMSKLVVGLF